MYTGAGLSSGTSTPSSCSRRMTSGVPRVLRAATRTRCWPLVPVTTSSNPPRSGLHHAATLLRPCAPIASPPGCGLSRLFTARRQGQNGERARPGAGRALVAPTAAISSPDRPRRSSARLRRLVRGGRGRRDQRRRSGRVGRRRRVQPRGRAAGGGAEHPRDGGARLRDRKPRRGSAQVSGLAPWGTTSTGTIELQSASTCQPGWLPTFGGEPGVAGPRPRAGRLR